MEFSLTKDENIYGILRLFINEPHICKGIIKYKKYLEEKETLNYHYNRWENIAGSHYILRDTHHSYNEDKFSYIFNSEEYIVKVDHKLDFFKLTGISYQIVDLIHELIKLKNDNLIQNTFIKNYKDYLSYDDKLYSILSKKIMEKMKKL
jgi:hypothetical protein